MTQGTGKRGPRGSGTVRERKPGYWEVRVPARSAEGKPIQVSRYVTGTRRDAEKKRRELLDQVDKGHHRQRKKTVGDLLEKWYALVEPDRSPATYKRYRSNLDFHLLPAFGSMPLERLSASDLDDFYTAKRKTLKASSVRVLHQVMHTALKYGVKIGWLVVNPADNATPPKARSREIRPPTWDELALLVKVAMEDDPQMAMIIFLAASTGMRRGEMAGLRWENLSAYQVTIGHSVVDLGGRRTLVKETKHRRFRTISVAPEVLPFLAAHRQRMEARAANAGVELAPRAFVFSDMPTCGLSLPAWALTNRFIRIRDKVGLPEVRLHDLRHLSASFLFEQGYDAVTIGARLGHAGGQLAHDLYGHWSPARDVTAAASFGKVLPPMPLLP